MSLGLFTSPDAVAQQQAAAVRDATRHHGADPVALERAIADARERRLYAVMRSAVLWAVIGIPLLMVLATLALLLLARALGGW